MKTADEFLKTLKPVFYNDSPSTTGTAYDTEDVVNLLHHVIESCYEQGYKDAENEARKEIRDHYSPNR